jgi:hypothetical protein
MAESTLLRVSIGDRHPIPLLGAPQAAVVLGALEQNTFEN